MNCFQWQNAVSDHLDGTLIGQASKQAEQHLDTCKDCSERFKHYQRIRAMIAHQPRSVLPVPIRKSPLSIAIPRLELPLKRSSWKNTPWYIRTSVEGLGIAFTILFIIAMVPRVRSLYQKSLDRRLDVFATTDLRLDEPSTNIPLSRGRVISLDGKQELIEDDFAGADDHEAEESNPSPASGLSSTNPEIWRFNLKTDSPRDTRLKIIQILTRFHIPSQTPGFGGMEAPGGIQFDILIPQNAIPRLKDELRRLVHNAPATPDNDPQEAFTWFKNKTKRGLPAGKSRVVIWLSQM